MPTILSQTMFAVLTGAVNSGKSYQILSVLTAQVDGDRFALPCLFIMAEASGEGTACAVLNDAGACVVQDGARGAFAGRFGDAVAGFELPVEEPAQRRGESLDPGPELPRHVRRHQRP